MIVGGDKMQRALSGRVAALALLCTLGAGCVSLKPVVLDRKTQLENQILGAFQRLEDDLILASSPTEQGCPRGIVDPVGLQ